jgi:hypothetical protein
MSRLPSIRCLSVSRRSLTCLPVSAWKATKATASAATGFGQFSSWRITAASKASGMVVAFGAAFIPRVGLAKMSRRPLKVVKSDLSPFPAMWRRVPVSPSAVAMWALVTSEKDWMPASAHP